MDSFYIFLIRNDVWIYILSGLGLLWYASELVRVRKALRRAIYGLERERGQTLQRNALTFITLLLAIIGLVMYVNLRVAPTLPAELLRPPTPTPNILAPPLSSPTSPVTAAPTTPLAPTVTLRSPDGGPALPDAAGGTPEVGVEATATPTPPVQVAIGECAPGAVISSPPNNVRVSSVVTFFGTATADDFSHYDLQAYGPETGNEWQSLLAEPGQTPIFDAILGSADFGSWAPGDYFVRLLVSDSGGEVVDECALQLSVGPPAS
jgi:hypothetical protein